MEFHPWFWRPGPQRESRGILQPVASVGTAFHFIPSLFPPYPLSKRHGGFPALCPSNWDPSQLWESHVVLPSCASAKRVPQSRIGFWEKSRLWSSGLFKGPAPRGGAAPAIYRDREIPVPSSQFLTQSGACSESGHPGRWSPLSLPISLASFHHCTLPLTPACHQGSGGSLVQSVLEEARAEQKALASSWGGGECGLGRPPLSSGWGLIPPSGGASRTLGPSRHPASTGLSDGGTLLIPGLRSRLWNWSAPNASLVPPLRASARQTPPAGVG